MKTVEIKISGPLTMTTWINQEELQFKDGVARKRVEENTEYALKWIVIAKPGTKFSVEITKPDKYQWRNPGLTIINTTKFKEENTLTGNKDAGHIWFKIISG